ncbi:MAG TPA: 3-deoxy-D-manno-octulosonic acid transferase [Thermodesulfobacteriota bacterium]|nr:3-deoxy-D-manno-octulosonic acid transferase [Thermodesulfobacteriota bacterium]
MILFLYHLFFTFFVILYVPYLLLRSLFQKPLRKMLIHRMGFFPDLSEKKPVWIHAASVGEVICSVPLFQRIKKEFPGLPVLLTIMTQTGYHTAGKLLSEADWILFFPFDHPFIIRRATRSIAPRLLLIAETELWPNLLRFCRKEKIPIVLFNGRISKKSLKGYLTFKALFKDCLKSISLFLMQTEGDRDRIIEIGAPSDRTKVMGNLKFDQTFPPVTREERETLGNSLGLRGEDPLLIAGSTHAGEEEMLISLFKELKTKTPNLSLILAPRHLDRLEEVEGILRKEALPWTRKTFLQRDGQSLKDRKDLPPVILLDTLGELMRLYSLGTLVVIGGSLVPVGGHNPLEPLAFKKCILFGPYMFNFSEISKGLIENGGAIQVAGKEDLLSHLKRLLVDGKMRREVGEKGYQFLQKHRGATQRAFEEIRPFLSGE